MAREIGRITEIGGAILRVEWQIHDFFSLPESPNSRYRSETFRFANSSLYLLILPYGKTESSLDDIMLFLFKKEGIPEFLKVDYCVRTALDKLMIKRGITWLSNVREGRGHSYILQRPELLRRKDEIAPFGILTVGCILQTCPSAWNAFTDRKEFSLDLEDMFHFKKHTDISIHVGTRVFEAHKVVLAARSPVFGAMFDKEMTKKSGIVHIEDCDSESFETFLQFLYSGKVNVTESNISELYMLADKYCVKRLKTLCSIFMTQDMSVKIMCFGATVTGSFPDSKLFKFCQYFFSLDEHKVLQTREWKQVLKVFPQIANKFLNKTDPMA